MIKCEICGKEFQGLQGLSHHITSIHNMEQKDYYDTYFLKDNENICPICGNFNKFKSFAHGYFSHCSQKCAHLDSNVQEKYNKTMLDKYGFEHFFQDKETQEKIRHSSGYLNRDTNVWSRDDIVKRLKSIRKNKLKTIEDQYDCTQMKKLVDKYCSTAWKKLNLPIIKIGKDAFIENKYLNEIDLFMDNFHKLAHKNQSKLETGIVNSIKSYYNGKIIRNSRRIIKPLELDIYLPDLSLAIEFNGTYYHSTEMGTPKKYHLNKSIKCKKLNIRLIHIYEFEDLSIQLNLLKDLILGTDNYPKNDFNKNNLYDDIYKVKPYLTKISNLHIYTVGKLI